MSLDPKLEEPTRSLWRDAERATVGHFPGFSIDEIVAIRDFCWFGGDRTPCRSTAQQPLHRYLTQLADQVLAPHGHEAVTHLPACLESTTHASTTRLAQAIRNWPLSLQFVRGVDLCTDELGVPNWVFVGILNLIREAGQAASGLVRARFGRVLPTLRTTIHAGEDFVHLLTGLRYVDEAIEQLELREGDRIGHGVALGVDPNAWARCRRVAMCLEDRLFDLVWEWAWYSMNHSVPSLDRFAGIQYQIAELSNELFEQTWTPLQLYQLQQDLANPHRLRAVGFPDRGLRPVQGKEREKLLRRYLTNRRLFERGRKVIWVDPSGEGEVLAHVQAELRRKLGA